VPPTRSVRLLWLYLCPIIADVLQYDLRSKILHRGTIAEASVGMGKLANDMERFVAQLLLAVLNSEPRQGAIVDSGVES